MKKRILSCLMALALCLTLLPTAALAGETEGTAQTPPAVYIIVKERLTNYHCKRLHRDRTNLPQSAEICITTKLSGPAVRPVAYMI